MLTKLNSFVCLLFLAAGCPLLTVQNKDADSARTYEFEEWVAGKLSQETSSVMLCTQARNGLSNVFQRFREDIYTFTDESIKFVAASSPHLEANNASSINWVGSYKVSVQIKEQENKFTNWGIHAKIEGSIKISLIYVKHRKIYHSNGFNRAKNFKAPGDGLDGVIDVHKAAVHSLGNFPGLIQNLQVVATAGFGTMLHVKYMDEHGPQFNCYAEFSIALSEDFKVTESNPKKEYEEFVTAGLSQFKEDICHQARFYIPPYRTDIYYMSSEYINGAAASAPVFIQDIPTINFVCNYSVSINTIKIDAPENDYTVKKNVEGNIKIRLDKVTPRKSYHYNSVMKFTTPDAHREVLELHKVAIHQKGHFRGSIDSLELVATAVMGTQLHAKYMDKYGFEYICYAEFSILLGDKLMAFEAEKCA